MPFGEPQLARRNLTCKLAGADRKRLTDAVLWILNQTDGQTPLVQIAERSQLGLDILARAAELLVEEQLIEEIAN